MNQKMGRESVMEMPCGAGGRAGARGVLRLRKPIPRANRFAALRKTICRGERGVSESRGHEERPQALKRGYVFGGLTARVKLVPFLFAPLCLPDPCPSRCNSGDVVEMPCGDCGAQEDNSRLPEELRGARGELHRSLRQAQGRLFSPQKARPSG